MLDPVEFGKSMGQIVSNAIGPLLKRIEDLEARQPLKGDKGEDGKDAQPLDREQIVKEVSTMFAENFEEWKKSMTPQKGDKGDRGDDGKDADQIDVKEVVAELLTCPEINTLVDLHAAAAVEKHFEAHPVKDGKPGEPGAKGDKGDRGEPGEKGLDGIGQAGAMIDRDGCLIITTTKGEAKNLGTVVGKDGSPGKDGADFSDCSIEYDGVRSIVIRSKTGAEITKRLPIPMDAGYWRDGMSCEKGDIVTQQGNAWIALRDTKAKPCTENKEDWRLFARKGKDGVDGRPGRDLGPAPPVKLNAA